MGDSLYLKATGIVLYSLLSVQATYADRNDSQLSSYNYSDQGLLIRFRTEINRKVVFNYYPLDPDGKRVGPRHGKSVPIIDGIAALPVTNDAGHYVSFRLHDRTYCIRANRGVQFPGDNATGIRYSDQAWDLETDIEPTEILIASGFRGYARAPVSGQPFEIGRTLGVPRGAGIKLRKNHALVVVAKGTVEAVILILTQKLSDTHSEYWEFPLVIDTEFRRYVIPFSHFRPRQEKQAKLSSFYAVAFRTISAARPQDELTVDMLALTDSFALLKKAKPKRKDIVLGLQRSRRIATAEVYVGDDRGNIRSIPVRRQRSIHIPYGEETRYFMCYGPGSSPSSRMCDPPDAPHTSYRLPVSKGSSISIDLFEEGLPLNAYRELTYIYSSGMDSSNAYKAKRGDRHLELVFYPGPPSVEVDYAGYSTPIPDKLPSGLLSVKLNVCKATASQTTMVGLRDITNREPKIALGDYMDSQMMGCQDAAIPLEAFRSALPLLPNKPNKLKQLKNITVTLEQGDEQDKHELELRKIEFTPTRMPLKVASFDRLYDIDPRWRTAFRRPVWTETSGDASMILSEAAGKIGRSLKVEIQDIGGSSYGLVALSLGWTDVSPYQLLTFWVRGLQGGEQAAVYLNDGVNRKSVLLREFVLVSTEWQRVEIPLDLFRNKVRLHRLRSIFIAWEDQLISKQTVYLDDFGFE